MSKLVVCNGTSFNMIASVAEVVDARDAALKAVEALTEIVRDYIRGDVSNSRVPFVEALNALRMGCEAIRMGRPDSMFAMNILARKTPPKPRRIRGRVGIRPIGRARNGGKKS